MFRQADEWLGAPFCGDSRIGFARRIRICRKQSGERSDHNRLALMRDVRQVQMS